MKLVRFTVDYSLGPEPLDCLPISSFNNNIFIVGSSGAGKSYLGKKIFDEVKPKLTFIYKEDRIYSDFVRVSDFRPDISVNPLEFPNSFNDYLNISSTGSVGHNSKTCPY